MIKVASVKSVRRIEAEADASGISYDTMMLNAGRAAAERVLEIIGGRDDVQITVLIGPGNNGGDGLVAGRIIAEESSALVRFYLLSRRDDNDPHLQAVRDAGLVIAVAEDDQRYRVLHHMVASAHILIDALFGIGIRLPLRGEAAKLLQAVQQALHPPEAPTPAYIDPAAAAPRPQRTYTLAIDCPSGLDCDTGALDKNALHADETITFIAAKPGLFCFPGAEAVGRLTIAPISIPPDLKKLKAEKNWLADSAIIRERLPSRSANAHKGSTGKVLIAAGSRSYFGAPALAAQAAYRVGAGLVAVAASEAIIHTLAGNLYEPVWLPLSVSPSPADADVIAQEARKCQAFLMGPGWGQTQATADLLTHLLHQLNAESPPLVIDADGLNLLAKIENWWEMLPPQAIITPHPGEMARLCGVDTAEVQAQRWQLAAQKAAEWGVIVVLKGAHTLIAAPDGEMAVLPFKTDALATAGTGDVLAGMISGMLAQGLKSFDAAVVAGYLHGLAGLIAAENTGSTRSVLAGDVITAIGAAFQRVEGT